MIVYTEKTIVKVWKRGSAQPEIAIDNMKLEDKNMRRIKIEFPKANIVCYAKVLEDKYPEVADELWEAIAEPMVCEAHNTLSTGDYVQCRPIPPYHVPKHVGDQSNPLGGGDVPALCDCKNGDIAWSGWYFACTYGPCTEPLPNMGPIMALVEPEYLEDFHRGGMDCWNHTYLYHELATVVFSREEA